MKTAGSNLDDAIEREERLVRRRQRTRNEKHAVAFVGTTDTMNRVCKAAGDEENDFLTIASRHVLSRVEW